jgi:hypothetical protein
MSSRRFGFLLLAAAVAFIMSVVLRPKTGAVLAEPPQAIVKPTIDLAFIYNNDKESADSYQTLLEEAGFSLQQIRVQAAAKTDFRSFAAILVGSDTARLWGGSAQAVDKAKKPILGLGEGGYDFFGDLKLAIGAPHGWHGNDRGVFLVNPAKSDLWAFSKAPVKVEEFITVYETTNHVGIYVPKPAEDVLLLGREEKDAQHFPLLRQGSHYVLWGFTASPNQVTRAGKEFFVATCRYTAGLGESRVGEPPAEEAIDPFRKKSTSKAP